MIGIPYGSKHIGEDGKLYTECAECHTMIPEQTDATGETVGNPYGEHWEQEHAR